VLRSNYNCAARGRKKKGTILQPTTCFYEAQRGKKLHASTVSPQRQGDKAKLLDRVRDTIRVKHYSLRTENVIQ